MPSPLENIAFLARSEHRVTTLRALREDPSDRDDLQGVTDASNATIARLLNEFEERNWVVRDGHEYELTDPGAFVAEEFLRLVDRMETEQALQEVWQWFPTELPGCRMSLFVDAITSWPHPRLPYQPFPRFVELIESTGIHHGFTKATPKPETYEVWQRILADGGELDFVFPDFVVGVFLEEISETAIREAVESGRLAVSVHDSIPTNAGISTFGDHVVIFCRDDEGVGRAMVDTDKPEAVAWGKSTYEEIRAEANPVAILERLDEES
jgi:predicted transcriptional regulator